MICRICALALVASALFTTGCTINHYEVVHKDQYLVIIGGSDKDHGSEDEDSEGQVTAVPVGKKAMPVSQPSTGTNGSF